MTDIEIKEDLTVGNTADQSFHYQKKNVISSLTCLLQTRPEKPGLVLECAKVWEYKGCTDPVLILPHCLQTTLNCRDKFQSCLSIKDR